MWEQEWKTEARNHKDAGTRCRVDCVVFFFKEIQ